MKKTLITLAALAMASVAGAATEDVTTEYAFSNGVASLGDALTQEYSWTLTGTVGFGSEKAGEWGTALIATGSNPTADAFAPGFQLFLNTSGTLLSKFNGDYYTEQDTGFTGLWHGSEITYTLSFDSATDVMTLTLFDGSETKTRTGTYTSDFSITSLSSNTHQATTGEPWEVSAVSVTRTLVTPDVTPDTPAVPEPATATLSLLALAGLAARRRRK